MRQRGFTLLELMVVLAILALATLLALPAGTAVLQRTSLDTAARDLADGWSEAGTTPPVRSRDFH